ncbi:MAG: CHAD domain-containing protein [Deltaproteobacteria bacterium]|nr:CHAD domain-containing protein [Deltaproteobacteria bacterium]
MSAPPSPTGAYPEHDKLGPLATGGGDSGWRAALLGSARATIADGRAAAAQIATAPVEAVHGVRKALRRMRAIAELAADVLPDGIEDLVDSVRTARRDLARARDLDVAPAAIAELPLGEADRAAANALVAGFKAVAPPAAEVAAAVARAVTALAAVGDALDASLPAEIADDVLLAGVRRTYRTARRERRRARDSRRGLHRWRRRSKELSYQLGLLTAAGGARTAAIATPIATLADDLGPIVDLLVIRDLARAHVQPAEAPIDLDGVRAAAGGLSKDAVAATRKASRELFADGSRRFARRLGKALAKDRGGEATADDGDHGDVADIVD